MVPVPCLRVTGERFDLGAFGPNGLTARASPIAELPMAMIVIADPQAEARRAAPACQHALTAGTVTRWIRRRTVPARPGTGQAAIRGAIGPHPVGRGEQGYPGQGAVCGSGSAAAGQGGLPILG